MRAVRTTSEPPPRAPRLRGGGALPRPSRTGAVRRAVLVPVLAWTVDVPEELERVVAAGVDGVITNDPRIFH